MNTTIRNRIERIVTDLTHAIVKHGDDVRIESDLDSGGTVLVFLTVNHGYMRAIVGSRGANVQAFQQIIFATGRQSGTQARFVLEEPCVGVDETMPPFVPKTKFDHEPDRSMVSRIVSDIFDCPVTVESKSTGKISTTYFVTLPEGVPIAEARIVANALNTLIHASGKARRGRHLFTRINVGDEPAQPENADGRYATETR